MGWTLRGLALVGVSVASGLIWLALTGGSEQKQAQGPQTEHDFNRVIQVDGQQKCADVSAPYSKIQDFFKDHRCEHLSRGLYTTTLPDGQKVLTSIVSVRLADPATASELKKLVDKDGTGNIDDLVTDDDIYPAPDDFPPLTQDIGFYSEQQGKLLVVGESGYFGKPADFENGRLGTITKDASKLAWQQDTTS